METAASSVLVISPMPNPSSVYNRDFRFNPIERKLELLTQTFQFGHSFDEWYNRFVCR